MHEATHPLSHSTAAIHDASYKMIHLFSQVVSGPLLARLPLFTPLRGTTLLSTGVLTAPVACAAVSFLHVSVSHMYLPM